MFNHLLVVVEAISHGMRRIVVVERFENPRQITAREKDKVGFESSRGNQSFYP
jgi:hypothetical protein